MAVFIAFVNELSVVIWLIDKLYYQTMSLHRENLFLELYLGSHLNLTVIMSLSFKSSILSLRSWDIAGINSVVLPPCTSQMLLEAEDHNQPEVMKYERQNKMSFIFQDCTWIYISQIIYISSNFHWQIITCICICIQGFHWFMILRFGNTLM